MGILQCKDNRSPSREEVFTFNGQSAIFEYKPLKNHTVENSEEFDTKNSELEEESRDIFIASHPVGIVKEPAVGNTPKASTFPAGTKYIEKRPRKNSAPPVMYSISYSISKNQTEQVIKVDESIIEDLASPEPRPISTSKRFKINRKSFTLASPNPEKPKKKVRFDDNVTIHRIEAPSRSPQAMPQMFKLYITLREVWYKVDIDADGWLNLAEFRQFCNQVWEEPECDLKQIMGLYAKDDPAKGLNFNEWCTLIKDEDPELSEFVDDLYNIFVEYDGNGSSG